MLALRHATCLFDLATDKLEPLPLTSQLPLASQLPRQLQLYEIFLEPLAHLTAFLKPGMGTIQLRNSDFIHNGWLYTSRPFGRVSLDGTNKQAFPNLRSEYLETFRPWECFQVVGDQILIADQHALWLAKMSGQ